MTKRKYVTALLLSWFLGFLGIHRFYTGYTAIGITILLCTLVFSVITFGLSLLISLLWVSIDFISICFNSYKDAEGNELIEYEPVIGKLAFTIVTLIITTGILKNGLTIFDIIQTKF